MIAMRRTSVETKARVGQPCFFEQQGEIRLDSFEAEVRGRALVRRRVSVSRTRRNAFSPIPSHSRCSDSGPPSPEDLASADGRISKSAAGDLLNRGFPAGEVLKEICNKHMNFFTLSCLYQPPWVSSCRCLLDELKNSVCTIFWNSPLPADHRTAVDILSRRMRLRCWRQLSESLLDEGWVSPSLADRLNDTRWIDILPPPWWIVSGEWAQRSRDVLPSIAAAVALFLQTCLIGWIRSRARFHRVCGFVPVRRVRSSVGVGLTVGRTSFGRILSAGLFNVLPPRWERPRLKARRRFRF